jgi:hypothetical protein
VGLSKTERRNADFKVLKTASYKNGPARKVSFTRGMSRVDFLALIKREHLLSPE